MGPGEWPPRSGNQKTFRPGTKGRSFRGATHIRQCRSLADGSGSRVAAPVRFPAPAADATPADRCCPLSLALCAGAYWRALEARGLVRRLTGPFVLVAAPACTNRWFSTPAPGVTRPDHSPYWECGGSLWAATGRCQMGCRRVGRRRRDRRQVARGLAILPEVRHADARRAAHGSRRSWRLRSCQMFTQAVAWPGPRRVREPFDASRPCWRPGWSDSGTGDERLSRKQGHLWPRPAVARTKPVIDRHF